MQQGCFFTPRLLSASHTQEHRAAREHTTALQKVLDTPLHNHTLSLATEEYSDIVDLREELLLSKEELFEVKEGYDEETETNRWKLVE